MCSDDEMCTEQTFSHAFYLGVVTPLFSIILSTFSFGSPINENVNNIGVLIYYRRVMKVKCAVLFGIIKNDRLPSSKNVVSLSGVSFAFSVNNIK